MTGVSAIGRDDDDPLACQIALELSRQLVRSCGRQAMMLSIAKSDHERCPIRADFKFAISSVFKILTGPIRDAAALGAHNNAPTLKVKPEQVFVRDG